MEAIGKRLVRRGLLLRPLRTNRERNGRTVYVIDGTGTKLSGYLKVISHQETKPLIFPTAALRCNRCEPVFLFLANCNVSQCTQRHRFCPTLYILVVEFSPLLIQQCGKPSQFCAVTCDVVCAVSFETNRVRTAFIKVWQLHQI